MGSQHAASGRKAVAGALIAFALVVGCPAFAASAFSLPEVASALATNQEPLWRSCTQPKPPDKLSARALFAYALVLAEARQHPERLERLFDLAAQMQDRDRASRQFGNFRWYWSDEKVADANAVDFCMRGGSLLWIKHRDFMPASARARLRELLDLSVEGSMRHHVPPSYSNISLMNAGNLILLGETLGDTNAASEGYARLDDFVRYTWENGIHEFVSPTYTGVDLDGLVMIETFGQRESGRTQARALLELFWTDIAANWFPAAQKLAGAHSRTYDYLRGLGYLDVQLRLNGWIDGPLPRDVDVIYGAQARWHPAESLRALSQQFPRLVRQIWGSERTQARTHLLLHDVTLSTIASSYGGRMDMPLTVDFPGERTATRGYFIADGRADPYGKNKIAAGPHQKAFHLDPLWTAAQQRRDALGLVVYRAKDIPTNATTLASHFVLPLSADEIWVGDRRVTFNDANLSRVPVKAGEVVAVRVGGGVFGLRVPWSRGLDGTAAPAALVFDGNKFGAVRFTVEHSPAGRLPVAADLEAATPVGVALWARVESGLTNDAAFRDWRREFAQAHGSAEVGADSIHLRAAGVDGAVALRAAKPWSRGEAIEPSPTRAVLEINGRDVGRETLGSLEVVRQLRAAATQPPIVVPVTGRGFYWEAESGFVRSRMAVGADAAASGGKFVWPPGEPGGRGAVSQGSVAWRLSLAKPGTYFIWGRVLAPTPSDDSFFVHLATASAALTEQATWSLGTHARWEWVAMNLGEGRGATPLNLPAGEVTLELRIREDGAKIDRLFLTTDAKARPE